MIQVKIPSFRAKSVHPSVNLPHVFVGMRDPGGKNAQAAAKLRTLAELALMP